MMIDWIVEMSFIYQNIKDTSSQLVVHGLDYIGNQ